MFAIQSTGSATAEKMAEQELLTASFAVEMEMDALSPNGAYKKRGTELYRRNVSVNDNMTVFTTFRTKTNLVLQFYYEGECLISTATEDGTVATTGDAMSEELIQKVLRNKTAVFDDNVEINGKDYYGFIRETSCPAIIIECAFVDNVKDLKILGTEDEKIKMGQAIAKGILNTLGIKIQAETNTIYRVQVGAYSIKANAKAMQKKLKEAGFSSYITK
jgi:N-acetylmuramoyl-L-alanine amidase